MRAAAFDVYLVRPLPDRLGTAGILLSILSRLARLLSCRLFAAGNALRFQMFILPSRAKLCRVDSQDVVLLKTHLIPLLAAR